MGGTGYSASSGASGGSAGSGGIGLQFGSYNSGLGAGWSSWVWVALFVAVAAIAVAFLMR